MTNHAVNMRVITFSLTGAKGEAECRRTQRNDHSLACTPCTGALTFDGAAG